MHSTSKKRGWQLWWIKFNQTVSYTCRRFTCSLISWVNWLNSSSKIAVHYLNVIRAILVFSLRLIQSIIEITFWVLWKLSKVNFYISGHCRIRTNTVCFIVQIVGGISRYLRLSFSRLLLSRDIFSTLRHTNWHIPETSCTWQLANSLFLGFIRHQFALLTTLARHWRSFSSYMLFCVTSVILILRNYSFEICHCVESECILRRVKLLN